MKPRTRVDRSLWVWLAALCLALASAPWQPSLAGAVDEAQAAQVLLDWLDGDDPSPPQAGTAAARPDSAVPAGGSSTVMQVP